MTLTLKSISSDLPKTVKDVKATSEEYAVLKTDEERVRFTRGLFRDEFAQLSFTRIGKSPEKSRMLRESGNDHFRKNDLWRAVNSYTESIAHAPSDSEEFSLALGNRAAALLRLNLIKEALTDVENVLTADIPQHLKNKMLDRREKCLASLGKSRVPFSDCGNVELPSKSNIFSSASVVVGIRDDEIFGRCLIATDDVKTGEVLVIEKPYSNVLIENHFYTHCTLCLRRSFNLIPCPSCNTSLYCSEECLAKNRLSHMVQCQILEILTSLKASKLELLSLKVLMDASEQGQNLDKLYSEISDFDKNNIKQTSYDSADHINIYRLVGNTEKRSNSDLFQKSVITCIILTILEKCSNFFDFCSQENKENLVCFAGGLILRYLQSMPCNAHEISEYCDNDYDEIGAGAYATLSLINHSCDPNVVRHCYRESIVLRAIRPIRKGEQLFDNYGYHYALLTVNDRQDSLLKNYYFKCTCEACVKMWPLQENLPETVPKFKDGTDVRKYEVLTEVFKKNVEDILTGDFEARVVTELMEYLDFLDEFVERPWRDYNICQEAIKHCLGLQGNCFRLSMGIQTV